MSFIFDVIHSSFPSSRPLPIGKPEPSIKWFRDDKEISSGKAYQTSYKKGHVSLKIFKCKSSDSAKYKCVAQNECGTAVSTAQLVVQGQSKYLSLKSAQFIIQKWNFVNFVIWEKRWCCILRYMFPTQLFFLIWVEYFVLFIDKVSSIYRFDVERESAT